MLNSSFAFMICHAQQQFCLDDLSCSTAVLPWTATSTCPNKLYCSALGLHVCSTCGVPKMIACIGPTWAFNASLAAGQPPWLMHRGFGTSSSNLAPASQSLRQYLLVRTSCPHLHRSIIVCIQFGVHCRYSILGADWQSLLMSHCIARSVCAGLQWTRITQKVFEAPRLGAGRHMR